MHFCAFFLLPYFYFKTDYQNDYKDCENLIVTHVNLDGRSKAKEYIKKLADKNKGKTLALNDFIDNYASDLPNYIFYNDIILQKKK